MQEVDFRTSWSLSSRPSCNAGLDFHREGAKDATKGVYFGCGRMPCAVFEHGATRMTISSQLRGYENQKEDSKQSLTQERQVRRILSAIFSAGTQYVPLAMFLRIRATFAARVLEFHRGRSGRRSQPFEPAERSLPFIAISSQADTPVLCVSTAWG